jgi:hypothetical protein
MLWPWIVALLTYGLFGASRGSKLPSPAEIAAKTRAMMKPVSPERNTAMNDKSSRLKKFWTDHKDVIIVTAGCAVTGAAVAAVSYRGGQKNMVRQTQKHDLISNCSCEQ